MTNSQRPSSVLAYPKFPLILNKRKISSVPNALWPDVLFTTKALQDVLIGKAVVDFSVTFSSCLSNCCAAGFGATFLLSREAVFRR